MNGVEKRYTRDCSGKPYWTGDLSAALLACDQMPGRRGNGSGSDSAMQARAWNPKTVAYYGFATWTDAREHFRAGYWSPQMAAIEANANHRQPAPGNAVHWDVAGDEVDVGRYLTGEPESMICWAMKAQPATVQLLAYIGVSSSCSTDILQARGAAMCAVVDTLETHGIAVELTAQMGGSEGRRHRLYWEILLKGANQPLHPGRVGAILGHPAGLRMLGLRLADAVTPPKDCIDCYGIPTIYSNPNEHVLAPDISQCHDQDYLAEWTRKTVDDIIEVAQP